MATLLEQGSDAVVGDGGRERCESEEGDGEQE